MASETPPNPLTANAHTYPNDTGSPDSDLNLHEAPS